MKTRYYAEVVYIRESDGKKCSRFSIVDGVDEFDAKKEARAAFNGSERILSVDVEVSKYFHLRSI